MKNSFSILTNVVSPHMLPLARAIATGCKGRFAYFATDRISALRKSIGWSDDAGSDFVVLRKENEVYTDFVTSADLLNADVLLMSVRDWRLIMNRYSAGRKTLFQFERWFRPPYGVWRLLYPPYLRMAYHFAKELMSGHYVALPIGVHAARDMARLCGLFSGDISCIFRAPQIRFERKTGGVIFLASGASGCRYGLDNMRMWAYYVGYDNVDRKCYRSGVMWVGRYLPCKRVEDIIQAAISVEMTLDLYGTGPDENYLRSKYCGCGNVCFHDPLSAAEVREQMRRHAIYVFASDAGDGWGVVVNEAMLEGMAVVGSVQPGSPATLIEDGVNGLLFNAGDVNGLKQCLIRLKDDELRNRLAANAMKSMTSAWTPEVAAKYLFLGD